MTLEQIIADVLLNHTVGMDRENYVNLCREMAFRLVTGHRPFDRAAFMEACDAPDGTPRR